MFGKSKLGCVYLLRALDSDQLYADQNTRGCSYKIGKSKDAVIRHSAIGVKLPYPVELLCVLLVDDMKQTEDYIHDLLNPFHLRGEWFALQEVHVAWFFQLCWEIEQGNWRGVLDIPSQFYASRILTTFNQLIHSGMRPLCDDAENHHSGVYSVL
jgi:hypothetical protein